MPSSSCPLCFIWYCSCSSSWKYYWFFSWLTICKAMLLIYFSICFIFWIVLKIFLHWFVCQNNDYMALAILLMFLYIQLLDFKTGTFNSICCIFCTNAATFLQSLLDFQYFKNLIYDFYIESIFLSKNSFASSTLCFVSCYNIIFSFHIYSLNLNFPAPLKFYLYFHIALPMPNCLSIYLSHDNHYLLTLKYYYQCSILVIFLTVICNDECDILYSIYYLIFS